MELYHVDDKSVFEIRDESGNVGVISYLVHHDWANGWHFSYGFDPNKESTEEAMGAFQRFLTDRTATRFNADGGRLDGKDCAIVFCPECGMDHGYLRHGEWLKRQEDLGHVH